MNKRLLQGCVLFCLGMTLLSVVDAADMRSQDVEESPDCISVVGDSVAYGTLVAMFEGQGFATIRTESISVALQTYLDEQQIDLEVRDRSVPASSISYADTPYQDTQAYQDLLEDRCAYVWILPWVNDLTHGRTSVRAYEYIDALTHLSRKLSFLRPDVQIVVTGYYPMRAAAFTQSYYGNGASLQTVELFNTVLTEACADEGSLAVIGTVHCLSIFDLFSETEYSHVYDYLGQIDFTAILYEPIPNEAVSVVQTFWQVNPNGTARLDGVHLSAIGKITLIEAFVTGILESNDPMK